MSNADKLAELDEQWESVEATEPGAREEAPDGEYTGIIERFDFWPNRDGETPQKLLTEVRVSEGDHAGSEAPTIWNALADERGIGYTKSYLEMLGLRGVKPSELEQRLEPLAGTTKVAIRVVTTSRNGKTYRNTYINEVLGINVAEAVKDASDGTEVPASSTSGEMSESDIPFARPEYGEVFSERLRHSKRLS